MWLTDSDLEIKLNILGSSLALDCTLRIRNIIRENGEKYVDRFSVEIIQPPG